MIDQKDIAVIVRDHNGAQVIGFTRQTILPHLEVHGSFKHNLTPHTCKFCGKSVSSLTMEIFIVHREGISLWNHMKSSTRAALGRLRPRGPTEAPFRIFTRDARKRRLWRK